VGDVLDTYRPSDFPWHWSHRRKILAKTAEKSRPISEQSQILVLCGHAHTYYAKQLAQHAVMEASSLPIRANEIDVR
jgi:hypothetical protein